MKLRHASMMRTKKFWIITGVIVTIILLGLYVFLSVQYWQSMRSDATIELTSAKKVATKAIDPQSKMSQRRQAIAALDQDYSYLCKNNGWFQWQTGLFPHTKAALSACIVNKTKLTTLASAAHETNDYLKNEDALRTILAGLVIDSKQLTEKDWATKAINGVQSASEHLNQLKQGPNAHVVINEAAKRVDTLKTRWDGLVKANKAKDKAVYMSALDKLDQAYAGLVSISDVADMQLESHVSKLEIATKNL